jgi:Flagellar hook-associated protein
MPGIASLFNIGTKSLFANQAAIEVVGNNISNANTEGYSRQAVRLEDGNYISYTPGQLGTGVNAAEVIRYFDEFAEVLYNNKSSEQQRWQALYENLQNVEMVLNESNSAGVNDALAAFWGDWQTLATNPADTSVRAALLGHASNLEQAIGVVYGDMQRPAGDRWMMSSPGSLRGQHAPDEHRRTQLADHGHRGTGKNNANGLRDQRASLVRELAEKMDINYIDNGLGNVTITTKAGHTLVDGSIAFRLAFESSPTIADLTTGSTYNGTVAFNGVSSSEYTVEIVGEGTVASGNVTFKVSVDGGKTWLKDENGEDTFAITEEGALLPDGKGTLSISDGTGGP